MTDLQTTIYLDTYNLILKVALTNHVDFKKAVVKATEAAELAVSLVK